MPKKLDIACMEKVSCIYCSAGKADLTWALFLKVGFLSKFVSLENETPQQYNWCFQRGFSLEKNNKYTSGN